VLVAGGAFALIASSNAAEQSAPEPSASSTPTPGTYSTLDVQDPIEYTAAAAPAVEPTVAPETAAEPTEEPAIMDEPAAPELRAIPGTDQMEPPMPDGPKNETVAAPPTPMPRDPDPVPAP